MDRRYTDTNWNRVLPHQTGNCCDKRSREGDHITEEITYTDALPRKIREEYFVIPFSKVASPRNED